MDTALPQKFPFILDMNLAKANCTENRVCTSYDIVVLGHRIIQPKDARERGVGGGSRIRGRGGGE